MGPAVSELFVCMLVELNLTRLEILLQYVAEHPEFLPEETSPTPDDIWMMNAFHQYCGVPRPKTYSFSPPNTLKGALHWRILGNLLQRISPGAREHLARLHEKPFWGGSAHAPMATVSVPPSHSRWCLWPRQQHQSSKSLDNRWCPWLCLHCFPDLNNGLHRRI